MSNFVHGRRIARQRTAGAVSAALLECFPHLMAVSDETDPPYRDKNVTGPIFATWKEATILHELVRHVKPHNALEIGTSVGWTAAHIATALPPQGFLTCVDPFTETARGLDVRNTALVGELFGNMERAGVAEKYEIVDQESPAILPRIAPSTKRCAGRIRHPSKSCCRSRKRVAIACRSTGSRKTCLHQSSPVCAFCLISRSKPCATTLI